MPAKVFLDTNIIIYCYSQSEPDKQQIAIDCVQAGSPWISTQVLNETINTLKRKFSLDYIQIGAVVDELKQQLQIAVVSTNTIQLALAIAQKYQYSYFDSLIVASALEVGCDRLYSEDMQNSQQIDNRLTIINPFLKQT
jgi:predicted nucleic acid-binding protein